MAACVWSATRPIFGIYAPFGVTFRPTAPNYAVRTVSVLVLHERLLHKWNGTSIRCGVKSISSDVVARSIDVDDYVILLPSETHNRLHANYFIASFLCTVPFAFIFAACMYLQSRRYSITEDETMNEQESGQQQQRNNDASVSENQRDNSVSDTIADPYYSTIHDSHENETVEPYGVAKVCSQYGRAETRSANVREREGAD
ncbi:PREDICTED: uncharacterized protein LOC109465567 [Branchiostoma belcheri]|uniref:Uncharacterized protein LOC109465567 n=1 Tax=Branchiostoma belcheri TaxID=7741 RepID=A0A6P4Y852_BRABE|nr:PREDICTED: uncharacterized protein LOC109465567 [Branchiostoma belcheri]